MLPNLGSCQETGLVLKSANAWSYRGLGYEFSQGFIRKCIHTMLCYYVQGTYNQRAQYTYEVEMNSVHMAFNYRYVAYTYCFILNLNDVWLEQIIFLSHQQIILVFSSTQWIYIQNDNLIITITDLK